MSQDTPSCSVPTDFYWHINIELVRVSAQNIVFLLWFVIEDNTDNARINILADYFALLAVWQSDHFWLMR
jgi:hypothetical protein